MPNNCPCSSIPSPALQGAVTPLNNCFLPARIARVPSSQSLLATGPAQVLPVHAPPLRKARELSPMSPLSVATTAVLGAQHVSFAQTAGFVQSKLKVPRQAAPSSTEACPVRRRPGHTALRARLTVPTYFRFRRLYPSLSRTDDTRALTQAHSVPSHGPGPVETCLSACDKKSP